MNGPRFEETEIDYSGRYGYLSEYQYGGHRRPTLPLFELKKGGGRPLQGPTNRKFRISTNFGVYHVL